MTFGDVKGQRLGGEPPPPAPNCLYSQMIPFGLSKIFVSFKVMILTIIDSYSTKVICCLNPMNPRYHTFKKVFWLLVSKKEGLLCLQGSLPSLLAQRRGVDQGSSFQKVGGSPWWPLPVFLSVPSPWWLCWLAEPLSTRSPCCHTVLWLRQGTFTFESGLFRLTLSQKVEPLGPSCYNYWYVIVYSVGYGHIYVKVPLIIKRMV